MSAVILATGSRHLARTIRLAGGDEDLMVIAPDQVPAGAAQLLALAEEPESVRTVILDGAGDAETEERALQMASRMEQSYPHVSVVLVTSRGEEIALRALRSGVRDVLAPDAAVEDVRWAVRRTMESAGALGGRPAQAEPFTGRVITVASPKGGVGKTTIATNLAVALAQHSPTGTVLVDLDVQFGDVAAALSLDPTYTLVDVLTGPVASDAIALKTLLTKHESGLHVVPGVRNPADADQIGTAALSRLLETLKQEFRYVIIDTAPGLTDQTLAALDHATDLVLVSGLDVPSVRGMRKELEVLEELDLEPLRIQVLLNMVEKGGGLSVSDVAATLARRVDVVLPRSPKVLRSTNAGEPIVLSQPRDSVSKDLTALASTFAPLSSGSRGGRHRGLMAR
ncbi:AAA family ATPase [Ornithinimicrobium sufpigmenti]|uniref:AAA family ATPase n=1 Tax=Ornithinimicrobium sufpigmenti TaxID=2508882 RepID=UPI001035C5F0|nr:MULTISPECIES: AAA family ATPase [unclassified Ornithinimicrobium]